MDVKKMTAWIILIVAATLAILAGAGQLSTITITITSYWALIGLMVMITLAALVLAWAICALTNTPFKLC